MAFQKFQKGNINKGRNGSDSRTKHISDMIRMLKILDETQETPILLATPVQLSMSPNDLSRSEDKDDTQSLVENSIAKFQNNVMRILKKNSDDIALLKSGRFVSMRTPSVRRGSESFSQEEDHNSTKKIKTGSNLSKDLGQKFVASAIDNSQSGSAGPSTEWSTVARKPPSNQSKNISKKSKNIPVGSANNKELSANVSLVARGLSKGSTEEKLTDHLKDVGIEPLLI